MNTSIHGLSDCLLIATHKMADTLYDGTVIYITRTAEDFYTGYILNQQMIETTFANIAPQGTVQHNTSPIIMAGGPVNNDHTVVLHSADYQNNNTQTIAEGVSLTTGDEILKSIATGHTPKHYIILNGSCGWSPKQLQDEITNNQWLAIPSTAALLFKTPHTDLYKITYSLAAPSTHTAGQA